MNLSNYIILNDALDRNLLNDLQNRIKQTPIEQWTQASVERKQAHQVNTDIRSDKIYWTRQNKQRIDQVYTTLLNVMKSLRLGVT